LYVGERVQHLYDQHGLTAFSTQAWAEQTIAALTRLSLPAGSPRRSDNFEPLLHD
jgi:hypothetical protein